MSVEDIFISYRGAADSLYAADLLYAELSHAMGPGRVFLDSESIKPGVDFVAALVDRVRQARVVLAIIGPHWLTATGLDGRPRIEDPRDWVRRELAEAFDAGVPVVPVLTDNTRIPTEAELPAELAQLGRTQHAFLRQRHAKADIASLLDRLADLVPVDRRPNDTGVPRQLPLVMKDFVGRTEQLATLDALLADTGDADAVVVSAVAGTAGVGKTTLAVQWGYRVQHLFPGGTLYVNLRGYGPGEPATPGEVLAGFLSALGVPTDRIPADVEARAGRYRSALAGRRVLVVLDNANGVEQVRPLLPGATGFVVVTSRTSLTGLVIGEGATRITLDVLTEPEALELVRAILGPRRADADPDSLLELVRACARLPLALRIAAGRAAAHPYLTVAEIVTELGGARGRLDALSVPADEQNSVRTVFDWSYDRLTGEQARMFRRLGLHPGPEFSVHAAAAVAGVEVADARRLLDALADHYLVEPVARDRYRFHDLLRVYAAERTDRDDAADRDRARRTLLQWYAHHAWVAARLIAPLVAHQHADSGLETPVPAEIVFSGPADALAWGEVECLNAVSGIRTAVRHDVLQAAVQLADWAVFPLSRRRLWDDLFEVCRLGLAAARRLGDRRGEYHLLQGLALGYRGVGQWQECGDTVAATLELARAIGDQWLQAQSLHYLGVLCLDQGRYAEAETYLRSALPMSVGAWHGQLEGDIELYLGTACVGLGRHEQALRHADRSLTLQREAGNPHGEAYVMHCMAKAHQGMGAHHEAITRCEEALRSESSLIDPREHAAILDTLGTSLRHTGDHVRAITCWREALTIFDEFDDSRAHNLRARIPAAAP